jgi:hypothetical protein
MKNHKRKFANFRKVITYLHQSHEKSYPPIETFRDFVFHVLEHRPPCTPQADWKRAVLKDSEKEKQ